MSAAQGSGTTPPTPRPSPKRLLAEMGRGAAFFALFGPPLGALSLLLYLLSIELYQGNGMGDHLGWLVVMFVLMSYPFGLLPAALAGLIAGGLRRRLRGWRGIVLGAGIGYAVTSAMVLALEWPSVGQGIDDAVFRLGLIGLVPAAILSPLLAERSGGGKPKSDRSGPTAALPDTADLAPHA